jgi:Mg-chelatase subunit ChlD
VNIAVDHPWWLLLSLVGVVSGVVGWRWMRGIPRFRRALAVGLRVVLFVILGVAMSGVYRVETADDLAVIALVDSSMSVQNFASFGDDDLGLPITIDAAARGFLARASSERQPDDRLGLIAFDGRVVTVALATKSEVLDRSTAIDPIEGTDIGGAIERARAQRPPDANARIVLISDGRTTTGSLDEIPGDIPIDVVPIRYSISEEVIVESVELPVRSLPDSIVDVRVVVRSLGRSTGRLLLRYNGEGVDLNGDEPGSARAIELSAGQRVVVLPVRLGSGRVHRFEARYLPDEIDTGSTALRYVGDTSLGNNASGGVTMTTGKGRVLIVSEPDASGVAQGQALIETYTRAGWGIDAIRSAQFPSDLLGLEGYDLVVLVNTPRDALELDADGLISEYVRGLGGGVLFVGGRDALGAGGWKGSSIEDILPVKLDVADDLVVPAVAVVLVLDSSGSMRQRIMGSSRSQQAVANGAAAGAIEILDEKDLIGVVSFSSTARAVVPIGPNDNPDRARSRIGSIMSSGGTNMGPALTMAGAMLDSVDANTKHIVLLSDGESMNPESLPGIAQGLADNGIKVSTIAVGDQADERGMRQIATLSGGVYYRVQNPSVLPRIFLKAIRVVRTPMLREGRITPVILEGDTPATGRLLSLPELGGLVITEGISDDPRVSTPIVSGKGEPILAFHQVELGRVAVFTSDVGRWGERWIESPVFSPFWTSVGAWAMRDASDAPGELSLVVTGTGASIEYNAIDGDGAPIDGLDVSVRVFDESGKSRLVGLVQVNSGQYVGEIDGLSTGVHVVIASPEQDDQALAPTIAGVEVSGGQEFRHLSADPQALIGLSDRTGGRVFDLSDPGSADLFDRAGLVERQSLQPIWTVLLLIAFALFVLDLAARRVAFDRWIAQARDETIAVSRAVRAEQLERLRASRADVEQRQSDAPEMDRSPMRAAQEQASPTPDEPAAASADEDANPLLAAKRRARDRMGEE